MWKNRIFSALGFDLEIVANFIPDLALLIGIPTFLHFL